MANKIIHKHSSVITDGKAKLPVASQLEYGELAINYAEGVETISMKNSANEIVEIKSTNYLEKIIIDNELVTANALINLENRLKTIEDGNLDLDDTYASKETFDEFATASTNAIKALNDSINNLDDTYVSKEGFEEFTTTNAGTINTLVDSINEINTNIEENELVTATALIELDDRLKNVENSNDGLDEKYTSKTEFDDYVTTSSDAIKALDTLITESNERFDNVIIENELVTATALIELDERIKNVENNNDGLDEKYTSKTEFDDYVTTSSDAIKALDTLITESNEHFDNVIIENELVTAKALTSINNRLKNIENGNDGLDEKYASKSEFESFSSTTADALKTLDTYITDINTNIEDNELVVSSALTDLDYRITNIEESGIGDVDFTVYATNESVDTKLANLVDSAPTTLDTLGELAAALKNNKDIVTVLEESIASKQSTISDLETIRSNASKGATALQSIPVEYVQINQLSAIATTGSYNDLSNKPTIPSIDGLATEEYVNTKFNEVFQNVSNGKFLIASAITDKGIYASDDETFQELSDKIDLIKVAPPGTNIVGYVDEQNDIYLSLSDLENGTYDLKYEDNNGLLADFYDIGTVEVN